MFGFVAMPVAKFREIFSDILAPIFVISDFTLKNYVAHTSRWIEGKLSITNKKKSLFMH